MKLKKLPKQIRKLIEKDSKNLSYSTMNLLVSWRAFRLLQTNSLNLQSEDLGLLEKYFETQLAWTLCWCSAAPSLAFGIFLVEVWPLNVKDWAIVIIALTMVAFAFITYLFHRAVTQFLGPAISRRIKQQRSEN